MNKSTLTKGISLGLMALSMIPCALSQTIAVSNTEEFYDAVNNPANAGVTLVLARGIYALSVNDPYGQPRPNAGRIELQPDMSLQGVEGDRSAVVINAYDLPAGSFPANGAIPGPNAAVRLGRGHNSLEWLSVRDARFAQANIDSGLQPLDPGTAYVRIAHVASSGSTRGLNVLNFGPAASYQTIEAEIVDSDFFENPFAVSEGVRTGNFQGARGSTVNVRMSGNRSWGQKQGLLVVNNRANSSIVNVTSSGNRFYDDGIGAAIIGALSSNNTRADGNTINFESHGDRFTANTSDTELDQGGLIVLGVEDISGAGGGSGNTVNVALWGDRMLNNAYSDLTGIGARFLSDATAVLNQSNRVTIEIRGDGGDNGKWQPVELFANALLAGDLPAAQNYGNAVAVIRY